jgi:hypothetical protein
MHRAFFYGILNTPYKKRLHPSTSSLFELIRCIIVKYLRLYYFYCIFSRSHFNPLVYILVFA